MNNKLVIFVSAFLLIGGLFLSTLYFASESFCNKKPYIDLPEEITEASVGAPLFVSEITTDTIKIAFDPMKDRLFHVQNPGCEKYICKGTLIWADLESYVIYIEDTRTELTFSSEIETLRNLVSILGDLSNGARYGHF